MKKHQKVSAVSMTYDELKAVANESPLLRTQVRIGDIKIIDLNNIEVQGQRLKLSDRAFADLVKRLGVPMSFQRRVDKLLGVEARYNMLNAMKTALSAQKNKRLNFVGNAATQAIVAIGEGASMLSNASYFQLAEQLIDKHNLEVRSCSISPLGSMSINVTSPQVETVKGITDANGEAFNPGISLRNSALEGTSVAGYTYRLVCSNGMIAKREQSLVQLSGFDSKELKEFYEKMTLLSKHNFVPFGYKEDIIRARNTYASLGELKFLHEALSHNGVGSMEAERFVPYHAMCEKYDKMKIDISRFTKQQFANAKTSVKLWDAINGVTDCASHIYDGIQASDYARHDMQLRAGFVMDKKTYDTENLVPSLI